MAWYPGATRMELQPESDAQPAIVPDQFIVHSLAAPWTARRTYEFWRDSSNLESHFGLGYSDLAQYIGTQTRADANAAANRRANGHGAVSLESASNTGATDPWNAYQIDRIVAIGVWLHHTHGIPLRICRTWDDPGFGYHRLFSAWNPSAHSCPGDARVKQFREVVFPRIKTIASGGTVPPIITAPKEEDMPLTDADVKKTWNLDFVKAPLNDPDNPTWAPSSYLRNTYLGVQEARREIAELGSPDLTPEQILALAAAVASAPGLADAIAEKVADKLAARLAE